MMNVKVKIYNGVKYNLENEKVAEVEYNNIRGYEVVTGESDRDRSWDGRKQQRRIQRVFAYYFRGRRDNNIL